MPRHQRHPAAIAAGIGAAVIALIVMFLYSPRDEDHLAEIGATVDAFHRAAAEADLDAYFDLLTDDARFLGTDASERWTKPVFYQYCLDRGAFEEAPAWVYTPSARAVTLGPSNRTAWFDEVLTHDRYGTLRGSGVLVLDTGDWKISQYNLTFLVPNDATPAVVSAIQDYESEPADAAAEDQPE